MNKFAKIAGCTAAVGATASVVTALVLFNKTIPRQDKVRVSTDEMADGDKWNDYIKIIHPNKEWFLAQDTEEITIKARDGINLHGDFLRADNDTGRVAICFHGYTSCGYNDCSTMAKFLHEKGFDVLVVDQRAHGKSEGKYIGFGILDRFDALAWIKYINERFEGTKDIMLFGVSMGGATVLMTSGFDELPENVKAIVADCAFTSPYDVFSHILKRDYHIPKFPVMEINDYISRKKAGYGFSDYSTLDAVKKTKCPILFIHGAEDDFVPTWMSQKNYEVCNSPKELLIVENAGHAASCYENQELYKSTVEKFVNKYIPAKEEI